MICTLDLLQCVADPQNFSLVLRGTHQANVFLQHEMFLDSKVQITYDMSGTRHELIAMEVLDRKSRIESYRKSMIDLDRVLYRDRTYINIMRHFKLASLVHSLSDF